MSEVSPASAAVPSPAAPSQFPQLSVVSAGGPVRSIPVNRPLLLFGSGPASDVKLKHADVAELHCLILVTPQGLVIRDGKSTSGTLQNGAKVLEAILKDGDKLKIGPFEFVIQVPPGWPPPEVFTAAGLSAALAPAAPALPAGMGALAVSPNGASDPQGLEDRAAALERERSAWQAEEAARETEREQEQAKLDQLKEHAEELSENLARARVELNDLAAAMAGQKLEAEAALKAREQSRAAIEQMHNLRDQLAGLQNQLQKAFGELQSVLEGLKTVSPTEIPLS